MHMHQSGRECKGRYVQMIYKPKGPSHFRTEVHVLRIAFFFAVVEGQIKTLTTSPEGEPSIAFHLFSNNKNEEQLEKHSAEIMHVTPRNGAEQTRHGVQYVAEKAMQTMRRDVQNKSTQT